MPDFTPRPTVYKGIKMRSRLEAGFAQWLDEFGVPGWQYEPKAFASKHGQYLPDFYVPDVHYVGVEVCDRPAYIEVKPHMPVEDTEPLARQMSIIWESEPDCLLLVAAPDAVHGGIAGVGVVSPADPTDPDDQMCIAGMHLLLRPNGCPLSIGYAVPHIAGPWFGEWWKKARR